jgi:hypothetical protein
MNELAKESQDLEHGRASDGLPYAKTVMKWPPVIVPLMALAMIGEMSLIVWAVIVHGTFG